MIKIIRKRWKLICITAVVVLCAFYVGGSYVIGRQVREMVAVAQASEPGDPVSALLSVLNSSDFSLSEKNSAVWALGQLGSPRALDALEAMHNGEECEHSQGICQYELEKAIELCRGGANPGALVWRHGELASL